MRKIIVGAQVSMDGVMQAPGAPTEDLTKGFKFGGWAMPYFDQEFGEELDRVFKEKFDLLLGRKTYEIFAAYWPYYEEDAPHGGIAKLFKDIKKYAVSRSGEVDTSWARSVLLPDIAHLCLVLKWPYNRLQMVRLVVHVRPDHILSSGADRHAVGRFVVGAEGEALPHRDGSRVTDPRAILDTAFGLGYLFDPFGESSHELPIVVRIAGRTVEVAVRRDRPDRAGRYARSNSMISASLAP